MPFEDSVVIVIAEFPLNMGLKHLPFSPSIKDEFYYCGNLVLVSLKSRRFIFQLHRR